MPRRIRRRRFRRRFRRARISRAVVATTGFRIPVRGNPRPTLNPGVAWHKRVVAVSIGATANTDAPVTYSNLINSLYSSTFVPTLKVRWIKVWATSPLSSPIQCVFDMSKLTIDGNAPALIEQDYGTGSALASVGCKIPYHTQNIVTPTSGDTSSFMTISKTTTAVNYVVHIGISFRC